MLYPERHIAEDILRSGEESNPGPWVQHSRNVARAAETIATHCGMDSEKAYVLGLLHDIGRSYGVSGMHHVIDGFTMLNINRWHDAARICHSHSFPVPDYTTYNGVIDCTERELNTLRRLLSEIEYDDYDRLIQLCDAIATADGITTVEARLIDVAIRHGVGNRYQEKWQAFLDIKKHFDEKCGCNIYNFFINDIENSIFA